MDTRVLPRAARSDVQPQEERALEREARYAVVGLFALAAIALAVAFVWWYSGASDRREYARYEIHFFGTVSGLAAGEPGALPRRGRGARASGCRSTRTIPGG